ncbi:uncharacterized protein LOC120426796 isoform X2 [Culex pipiens pallens]|uniref:uncharacterized protein LOC120426796 isoform X2 n=1 Tax=Culex pipiens pallens TaxID=42434 RepID=UPI0019547957|nr:uncharacterized protein LOC120426796 isoform X2 [Culex pipiens pallens]
MANESFDFNITKFLAEQKQLLALEKERFAVEKINLLEPASNEVATAGSSRDDDALKRAKDDQNAKLVGKGRDGNKENVPKGSEKKPEVEGECPVERMLREGSFQRLQVKHSPQYSSEKREEAVDVAEVIEQRFVRKKLDHLHSTILEGSPKTPDRQQQQDEMEQWVSDTFYSYFPSFNKNQNEKKSMLSRARQADYQEYLKNIPQVTTKHQQYMEKFGHQAVQTVNEVGTNTNHNNSGSNLKSTSTAKNYLSPSTAATPNVSFSPHLVTSSSSPAHNPIRKTVASEPSAYMRKDTIDRRNRMLAEEESRRKLEYQKELIKQIDEKRKEVERLREKEKLEEEMLTSRLEQQLKTMQLEEELEREKQRSEKIRLANEQNHIRRLQLLSKLENDHKVFNPYDADRKTLSENGKEIYLDSSQQQRKVSHLGGSGPAHPGKDKVYRYFSNSAQNPASLASTSLSSEMEYDSSSESVGQQPGNRYQYCKNCRADIDRSFLPPRTHSRHHYQHHASMTTPKSHRKGTTTGEEHNCLNCRKRIEKLCANCDRVMKRSVKKSLCAICQQAMENSRMQKEAQSELKRQRSKLLRSMEMLDDEEDDPRPAYPTTGTSPTNPYKIIDIQYHESDNDHDLAVLNPVIVRNNYKKQPYSVNIAKESLFHPSKKTPEPRVAVNIRNGEVFVDNNLGHGRHEDTDDVTTDEMDDRISKYVRHYNTLWMKRGMRQNNNLKNGNVLNGEKLSPSAMAGNGGNGAKLPSLSPPKVYVSDRPDNVKSDAMKTTEKKWDVPAVERTKVSAESPRVLTQLGAIRKQLQLEQLQMDNQGHQQQQQQHHQDHHN